MRLDHLSVKAEGEGDVRRITLPGGHLSAPVAAELTMVADDLVEDRSVRVVVIDSIDEWCAGPAADLDTSVRPDPASALSRLRVPVIAVVTGSCRSVGLEVLLATDMRVADPTASFSLPDLAEGRLPSWGGTQRLSRAVGASLATAMLLLGTELGGEEAAGAGLVHAVEADVEAVVATWLEELAGVGPLAAELAKEAVHRGAELPLRDGLRLEGDLNHLLQSTDDRAEGLAAFFAKRPPDFAGR